MTWPSSQNLAALPQFPLQRAIKPTPRSMIFCHLTSSPVCFHPLAHQCQSPNSTPLRLLAWQRSWDHFISGPTIGGSTATNSPLASAHQLPLAEKKIWVWTKGAKSTDVHEGGTHGKEPGNKMCWHLFLTHKKIQENKKLVSVVSPTAATFYFLKRAAKRWNLLRNPVEPDLAAQTFSGDFSRTLLNLA